MVESILMIVISNGFNKFHLTSAAAELDRTGLLSLLITGAYPKNNLIKYGGFKSLQKNAKYQRLLARGDNVDDKHVRAQVLPEVIHAMSLQLSTYGADKISSYLNVFSYSLYGRMAAKIIKNVGKKARIYHYRAGFGGQSVKIAKAMGLVTLCDHSSVHPSMASFLVDNGGRMPRPGEVCRLNRFERWLLADIEAADAIVVNSDFAKQTFLKHAQGSKPVHTIYWGVDDQFMKYKLSSEKTASDKTGPVRILFAGSLEPRKGAEVLLYALKAIADAQVNFKIIGNIDSEIVNKYSDIIRCSRVKFYGVLPRHYVARQMQSSHVFVFPSLSEGSARVIFEALACGCYVITTPNSGSIVEDGVHGTIIPPNDANELIQAIQWARKNRQKVMEIGDNNAKIISHNYTQRHYGQNLKKLYTKLLT